MICLYSVTYSRPASSVQCPAVKQQFPSFIALKQYMAPAFPNTLEIFHIDKLSSSGTAMDETKSLSSDLGEFDTAKSHGKSRDAIKLCFEFDKNFFA